MPLSTYPLNNWQTAIDLTTQEKAITELENNQILFFPHLNFALQEDELFLLSNEYSDNKAKNISFDPITQSLSGIKCNAITHQKMTNVISRFNRHAYTLVSQLLPTYVSSLKMGKTTYRSVEAAGRKAKSYRKDDTRLHVDAFPCKPTQGKRILRVFSNINPNGRPRVWHIGEPFSTVAERFLPQIPMPIIHPRILKLFKITQSMRTLYDHILLQIHHRMKADMHYQKAVPHTEIAFPPHSTWIVQTDSVSHAAISGQFLLEQTFYLPVSAMQNQDASPLRVLESMTKRKLV